MFLTIEHNAKTEKVLKQILCHYKSCRIQETEFSHHLRKQRPDDSTLTQRIIDVTQARAIFGKK